MQPRFQRARTSSRRLYGAPAFLSLVAALSGCADGTEPETDQEELGQSIQAIIGGTNSGAQNDSVVLLATFHNGVRMSFCSATVVAPNLVLTARHCVSEVVGPASCLANGQPDPGTTTIHDYVPSKLAVFVGVNGVPPDTRNEANAAAHGSKLVVGAVAPTCNNDLALVILDKAVTAPVAPIRLAPPASSEKVTAVGWGVLSDGQIPTTRQARSDLTVALGPSGFPNGSKYGFAAGEFVTTEAACAGDSGGPVLSAAGAVLGVASRTNNGLAFDSTSYATTCVGENARTVYAQLHWHEALVRRAFTEAGATPILETAAPQATEAPASEAAGADESPEIKTKAASAKGSAPDVTKGNEASAGGCSVSYEPQAGNVEYAAGLVALIASLVGLRRRFGRRDDESERPVTRERMPSLP